MNRVIGVIPARMGSTRFPGKPLAMLCGRPMLEHVYRGTRACPLLDEVIVATCDDIIARRAEAFGATVRMTSPEHERATDRVAEAARDDLADIVVMVQGDEPMVCPDMIAAALAPMTTDPTLGCVNLAAPIRSAEDLGSPHTIKVVVAQSGAALYFSRQSIPTPSAGFTPGLWRKQVCIMPFRRWALQRFAALPQGPLERAESIDMLRFLENGIAVRIVTTEFETHAVDTLRDLAYVQALMLRHSGPEP